MTRPGVDINLLNGQLGIEGPSENGITALVLGIPAAPTGTAFGTAFIIKSKAEVIAKFADPLNAAVVTALNSAFYGEAPEGTELHITCLINTNNLTTLAAAANTEKSLNSAAGKARLVSVIRWPDGAYTPTVTNGFDVDVHNAVPVLQTLANTWLAKKQPFRFLLPGYACDGVSANAKTYATETYRNGGIVVAELNASSQNATLSVLGRLARVSPQVNAGRVKSGSLNVPAAWALTIGGTAIKSVADSTLDGYWSKQYITLEQNQIAAGFIVTDDNTLTAPTDDYNNFRYGRVVDNAVRIAYSTYYLELKDDVDVDENGRLSKVAEKSLETAVETNIDASMRAQLSKKASGAADVKCVVNPDYATNIAVYNQNGITSAPNFNLLQTGKTYLFLKLKPKGCLKFIYVFIGYTPTS